MVYTHTCAGVRICAHMRNILPFLPFLPLEIDKMKYSTREIYEALLAELERAFGTPIGWPADWVICVDSEVLQHLCPGARQQMLNRARTEMVRRHLQGRLDEFREPWGDPSEMVAGFTKDLEAFNFNAEQRDGWIAAAKKASRAPRLADDGASVIYFVGPDGGDIKIGITSNFQTRLRSLKTGSSRPLCVLLVMPGTIDDERALHDRFAADRLHGEWFKRSAALMEFIASSRPADDDG